MAESIALTLPKYRRGLFVDRQRGMMDKGIRRSGNMFIRLLAKPGSLRRLQVEKV